MASLFFLLLSLVVLFAASGEVLAGGGGVKLYHISDFHYDPLQNTSSCSVGPCSQRVGTVPPAGLAGCDSGLTICQGAVRAVANQIATDNTTDTALVIVTGDFSRHGLWDSCTGTTPLQLATTIIATLSALLTTDLQNAVEEHQRRLIAENGGGADASKNTTRTKKTVHTHFAPNPALLSVVRGNEDHAQGDYFMNISAGATHPLLNKYAELFEQQGMINSDQATLWKKCGYYSKSVIPGKLRAITLNTLLFSTSIKPALSGADIADPCGQFAWLTSELKAARMKGERVYLMSHIGPLPFILWQQQYLSKFKALLQQYKSVVAACFFGHIHRFVIGAMSSKNNVPLIFAGGPITRVSNTNPDVTVYSLDTATFRPTDLRQLYLDPNAPSTGADPRELSAWHMSPSFVQYMGLPALTTANIHAMAATMRFSNATLFQRYWSFVYGSGGLAPSRACTGLCLVEETCAMISFDLLSSAACVL